MPSNPIITVFGDFNCPFCYALNERLQVYARDFEIRWKTVQHLPFVDSKTSSFQEQTQLTAEVASVRKRAPEVQIITPPMRPNTQLANLMVAAIERRGDERLPLFRTLVYRALWHEGVDISSREVLDGLAAQAGLAPVEFGDEERAMTDGWQTEWEGGDYDTRIPSMVNSEGGRMLGFPAIPRLMPFLQGQLDDDVRLGATCEVARRRCILVVGSNVGMVQTASQEQAEFSIVQVDFSDDLELLALTAAEADLVILDGSDPRHKPLCIRLQAREVTQHIPVVVYSQTADSRKEVEALSLGALDYMHGDQDPLVWLARSRGLARYKQSTELLGKLARIDGLTEIPNRREFDRVLEIEWLRAIRSGDPLSLLMLDIDNFKAYNDGYGHDAGDECLRQVALCLQAKMLRGSDFCARYGGEEFVCVLPDTDLKGAQAMAEKVRHAIEALGIPHEYANGDRIVTVSTGVASFHASARKSPVELLKAADGALYRAKEAGRNCVCAA
ncbi:MAG: diguanylate cyclase [Halieaceae bacterium]|jgi:diguanylate cyclase (GGDEF)-like protein|nr:diguanylate cyclase [Halieaceae bacterium]